MPSSVPFTEAETRLAEIFERATATREPVIITRPDAEDLALLPASDLRSLQETAHLFSTTANAKRLISALEWSAKGEGRPVDLESLEAFVNDRLERAA